MRPWFAFVLAATVGAIACGSSGGGDQPAPEPTGGDAGPDGAGPLTDAAGEASVPSDGLGWRSGTRLRAVVDTAGSAKSFVRWRDVQLQIDCSYDVAADGKTRCLPVIDGDVRTIYDDDQCKSPVGVVAKTLATPKYLPPANAPFVCGTGGDSYVPGAAYTPAALFTYDGASCTPSGAPDAKYMYLHVSTAAPSTFVSAAEATDPRGPRLSARVYAGEDGSRQDVDLIDSARGGARCAASELKLPSFYCVPTELAYFQDYFSDATCQTLVAFHPGYAQQVCNRKPTAVQDSTSAMPPLTLFEAGPVFTGAVYRGPVASCAPATLAPQLGATFYAPGAPLPVSSLAALTVKNEGTGRILSKIVRTSSGAFAANVGFFDTAKGHACAKQPTTDGVSRCLPSDLSESVNTYADSMCTQALVTRLAGAAAPAAGSFAQAVISRPNQDSAFAIFTVGAKIAAPAMVWQFNGSMCETRAQGGEDFYATTPVAASDFVAVTTAAE